MSHAPTSTEEIVKNYLAARSMVTSLKFFDQESSLAKDANYQVDRCIDEMTEAIEKHDVDTLCTMWESWNSRVFHSLDAEGVKQAQNYEASAYRLFLVRCVQKKNIIKCNEFFRRMSSLTLNNPQWTDWFSFPYNHQAKDTEPYRKYFDRTWIEIYYVSLHNFLSTSLATVSPSVIGTIVEGIARDPHGSDHVDFDEELIDDFAVIAQCSAPVKRGHSKPSLRNLLKSLTSSKKPSASTD
ncbi:hypothetical protein CAEBREN_06890 [Caenorhabditis brenneri]|uniref:ARMC9 CTLH-like domain-containing protein n=1 Tax=Caenorhabditis brenneri TaxID=135651 RepID=G0M7L8_CAEBE|nr:hypothetical protein CAEBREN_06890 [Caenorhabditis brenneri]